MDGLWSQDDENKEKTRWVGERAEKCLARRVVAGGQHSLFPVAWTVDARSHVKAHYRAGAGFGDFPNCLKQLQLSLKRSASVWSPWSPLDNVQGPSAVAAHLFQQEGLSSDGASGTSVREGRARGQQSGSVSGVPGSLLEIQVPGSLTRSAESETLGASLNDL